MSELTGQQKVPPSICKLDLQPKDMSGLSQLSQPQLSKALRMMRRVLKLNPHNFNLEREIEQVEGLSID